MLNPSRPWGEVTALARQYGVSRKFLYVLRDKAARALREGLAPQPCGPKPRADVVIVDRAFLQRAMVILATAIPGTVRGIQLALELLFDTHRAVGLISQTLQAAGRAAEAHNAELEVPMPVLGEADEIFQARRPCLTVVDGRSFLVVNLSAEEKRDAPTWEATLRTLQRRGIQFQDLAADGARGIRAALKGPQLAIPLRPDLFHLLQEGYRLSRRLEARAYRALETAERARRAEEEAQAPKRRRGRPLKVNVSRAEAEEQARQAIEHFDAWQWLFQEVRQALEPFNARGELTSARQARQTLQTAAELLMSLNLPEVTAFAQKQLLGHLDELVAPLEWLEQALAPWRQHLEPQIEAAIIWAWRHRQVLGLEAGQGFDQALKPVVCAFWERLELFHRSSSLAEALHSWLRPYLQVHRGMPRWLLPLLQLFWNHHTFERGKRRGQSPLTLAGVENAPSLKEALTMLIEPQVRAQAAI
jgi:nucleotide-binding universal stress UspA family protein